MFLASLDGGLVMTAACIIHVKELGFKIQVSNVVVVVVVQVQGARRGRKEESYLPISRNSKMRLLKSRRRSKSSRQKLYLYNYIYFRISHVCLSTFYG